MTLKTNSNSAPFLIAEIGINHNGDLDIAKKLIDVSVQAKADAVKFQKRTVDKVYSSEELDRDRESPWGSTNREQKLGLEFGESEYDEIDSYCKTKGIKWFASAWDPDSQIFLRKYKSQYNKVASAMLTVEPLLKKIALEGRHTFISTGMSTWDEIDRAVKIFQGFDCPFELMHCHSAYPSQNKDINLNVMKTMRERYNCKVGYSGHEKGIQVSLAAAALGASSIERHLTLDRSMYGSDQAASLGVNGFIKMARDIRVIAEALGEGDKKITDSEKPIRDKLGTPNWLKDPTLEIYKKIPPHLQHFA